MESLVHDDIDHLHAQPAQVVAHNCPGGGNFPGVRINVGGCVCGGTQHACIRIAPTSSTSLAGLSVYGDATNCASGGNTELLSTTAWNCVTFPTSGPNTGAKEIFFGPHRNGSSHLVPPTLTLLTTISFQLGIWVGCKQGTTTLAYNCHTYNVTMNVTSIAGVVTISLSSVTPTTGLCTDPEPCATC